MWEVGCVGSEEELDVLARSYIFAKFPHRMIKPAGKKCADIGSQVTSI